jgi:FkbH-like protein
MRADYKEGFVMMKGTKMSDEEDNRSIKLVIWDLDNTIWSGVLLEERNVRLFPEIIKIIKELDVRGILQSITSRNEYHTAMSKLEEFDINDFFLYPQINWNMKSTSIKKIAELINISLDSVAFIDDDPFEREEVSFSLPEIVCFDTKDLDEILDMPMMNPRFITEDSKKRRSMYQMDMARNKAEKEFSGPKEEFLATINMTFTIATAKEEDLKRAEELTMRTHQLNTTGYTYSFDELNKLLASKNHKLFIASLNDKYGTFGKIGLVLIECKKTIWTIKLFLMSCRVLSRGVGTVLINYIMNMAKKNNVELYAEFIETDKNRMMYITYKFAGFREIEKRDRCILFKNELNHIQSFPDYLNVVIKK